MSEGREFELETQKENEKELLKKVEATLFVAARYLTLQELNMLTGINPLMLKELLDKIKQDYEEKDSGMFILEKENMWKMDVRPEHANIVTKLATGSSEFTKAEQETLAIIAYKQPIRQSVVIKIRGNKAYEHVKHFVQQELVRAKKVSHTYELTLSEDFYDYFQFGEKEKEDKEEQETKKE